MHNDDTTGALPLVAGTPGVHKPGPEAGSVPPPPTGPASGKAGVVMGIDPSLTNTAVMILNTDGRELFRDNSETNVSQNIIERFREISLVVVNAAEHFDLSLIVIEGPSLGSTGDHIAQLCGLHFILRMELGEPNGTPIQVVAPSTLKAFVCTGKAQKQLMLKETLKKWGADFDDDNLCDAYCLARWGLAYLAGEVQLPRPKPKKKGKKK